MLRCNVKDMSDLELTEHLQAINAERERRRVERKECLWRDIADAVKAYCQEFGDIDLETEGSYQGCLDVHTRWDEIGLLEI